VVPTGSSHELLLFAGRSSTSNEQTHHLSDCPIIRSHLSLWLAYDRALVRPARTIEEAIFRLRLGNVVLLIVIIICMRVLGASAVVLWLLAVNPLVWNNFVLSVHNDVVPIALTLAAAICIRKRWTAAAVALVVAAGLSKITFSLIGLTAFAAIPVMRTRLAASTCAAACVVAGSVIFGGPPTLPRSTTCLTCITSRSTRLDS
jgi:hypothetical protein